MKIKRIVLATIFGTLFSFNYSQALTEDQLQSIAAIQTEPLSPPTYLDKIENKLELFINNENAEVILFSITALIILSFVIFYIIKNKNKKNL